jgi:hypothetical protein
MKKTITIIITLAVLFTAMPVFGGGSQDEVSAAQARNLRVEGLQEMLARPVSTPWRGE